MTVDGRNRGGRHYRRRLIFLLVSSLLAAVLALVGAGGVSDLGGSPRRTRGITLASAGENEVHYLELTQRIPVLEAPQFDWLRVAEGRSVMDEPSDLRLKIVTYNIRHGEGLDNMVSLDRIAEILKSMEPDLVALQEVDRNFSGRSNWEDQAQILSEKLGMHLAYGPALSIPRLFGEAGQYGNAVLSRYPIKSSSNQVVNFAGFAESRGYLHTVIETPAGDVNFISTHFGLKVEERSRHVFELLEYVENLSGPVIIAGDFNAVDTTEEVQRLFARGFVEVAGLLNQVQPTLIGSDARIDYLFISPDISVYDVVTLDVDGSDHRPVMGLVSIPLIERL